MKHWHLAVVFVISLAAAVRARRFFQVGRIHGYHSARLKFDTCILNVYFSVPIVLRSAQFVQAGVFAVQVC